LISFECIASFVLQIRSNKKDEFEPLLRKLHLNVLRHIGQGKAKWYAILKD